MLIKTLTLGARPSILSTLMLTRRVEDHVLMVCPAAWIGGCAWEEPLFLTSTIC
jgi:hypothetical protein